MSSLCLSDIVYSTYFSNTSYTITQDSNNAALVVTQRYGNAKHNSSTVKFENNFFSIFFHQMCKYSNCVYYYMKQKTKYETTNKKSGYMNYECASVLSIFTAVE